MTTKLILLTAGLCSGIAASAQRFVPAAGINGGGAATMFQNEYYKQWNDNAALEEFPKNGSSNMQFAPSFGVQIALANPERSDFYFSVGLSYSNFRHEFNNKGLETTAYASNLMYESQTKINLNYLQIPLNIGYSFKLGRISPFIAIGVAPSLLMNFDKKSLLTYDGFGIVETANNKGVLLQSTILTGGGGLTEYGQDGPVFKRLNWFANTQLGINVTITNKIGLQLAAIYQQGLNGIENHDAVKGKYFGRNYYTARGMDVEEIIVALKQGTVWIKEKPNRYNTKLASLGINAGIHIIF